MARPVDKNLLCRQWIHSREEDTANEMVFRPAGFPLPRSRGRAGLEFAADGTFKRIGIGATDISKVEEGTWQVDHQNDDQIRVEVQGQPSTMKIENLEQDRLTIKRNTP